MRKLYLAYGSNLNVAQMAWRCPHAIPVATTLLEGYQLVFRGSKTGNYLDIQKDKAGQERHVVPCVLWSVDDRDIENLDRYEGFPTFYRREVFHVIASSLVGEYTEEKPELYKADCFAYLMRADAPAGLPSQRYLDVCGEGYERFGFSIDYLECAIKYTKKLMYAAGKMEYSKINH